MFKKFYMSTMIFSVLGVIIINSNTIEASELKSDVDTNFKKEIKVDKWEDKDGEIYYTTDTPIKDEGVIEYLQSVNERNLSNSKITKDTEDMVQPYADFTRENWSRSANSLTNTDGSGKVAWSTSGYTEFALLKPVTADKIYVGNGTVTVTYTGTGTADKIVSGYTYTFSGVTMAVSVYPTLSASSKVVSWTSEPVTNKTSLTYTSRWAEATSRSALYHVDLNVIADVYKGSKIYNPRAYSRVYFVQG